MTRLSISIPAFARIAAALVVALSLAGCGTGSSPESAEQSESAAERELASVRATVADTARPIRGVERREVGGGATGATVLWGEELPGPPRDVVIFLHAWSAPMSVPEIYGNWLSHLARRGAAVIFPTYLGPRMDPREVADNMFAGVAAGLEALDAGPRSVVVAGHTTGGALALDYAAGAARADLPRPDAVFALYPGRRPNGKIPAVDPTRIGPQTQITILSGEGNPVVRGDRQARELLRTPVRVPRDQRRYVDIDPRAKPLGAGKRTRRAIWQPLDRLIAQAR